MIGEVLGDYGQKLTWEGMTMVAVTHEMGLRSGRPHRLYGSRANHEVAPRPSSSPVSILAYSGSSNGIL